MIDINNLVRMNIMNLQPYSSARDEFSGNEGVFLDANENPFGELNRYPDPYQRELKAVLANQKGIDTAQIFVGNGSDEVIDLLFRIFCNPGTDKALTFSPTYGMYDVSAAINAVELIKLPLTDSFQLDVDAAKELLKDCKIKLTFICSPNNPTGNAFPKEQIEAILQASQGIVVVDEAYVDFSEQGSMIDLINTYPNLVVSQTMSKARGLAAARVGFAFANTQIINLLNKVKPPYNVSLLNQKAALDALLDNETYTRNLQILQQEKERLNNLLNELKTVVKIYPSDANFLLAEFKDANATYQQLVDRKIIVRNRNSVVNNCIRITVGTPEENTLLINELKQLENEKSTVY
ncbi:MAG: histidinol-phosphate transaminase [Bacteroidetes bacterium]|nr:MAG: histidinol-phosphate transaminase [Bacteroidota bacterium]